MNQTMRTNIQGPKTCGECEHFGRMFGNNSGQCYYNPPTVFHAGSCSRPIVGLHERACGHFAQNVNLLPPDVNSLEGQQDVRELVAHQIAAHKGTAYSVAPAVKYAPKGKKG